MFFSDVGCTTSTLTDQFGLGAGVNNTIHNTTPPGSYYYQIHVIDNATNLTISGCSTLKTINP